MQQLRIIRSWHWLLGSAACAISLLLLLAAVFCCINRHNGRTSGSCSSLLQSQHKDDDEVLNHHELKQRWLVETEEEESENESNNNTASKTGSPSSSSRGFVDLVPLLPFTIQIVIKHSTMNNNFVDIINIFDVNDIVTDWMNSVFEQELVAAEYTEENLYAKFDTVVLLFLNDRRHLLDSWRRELEEEGSMLTVSFKSAAIFSRTGLRNKTVPETDVLSIQRIALDAHIPSLREMLQSTSAPGLGSSVIDVNAFFVTSADTNTTSFEPTATPLAPPNSSDDGSSTNYSSSPLTAAPQPPATTFPSMMNTVPMSSLAPNPVPTRTEAPSMAQPTIVPNPTTTLKPSSTDDVVPTVVPSVSTAPTSARPSKAPKVVFPTPLDSTTVVPSTENPSTTLLTVSPVPATSLVPTVAPTRSAMPSTAPSTSSVPTTSLEPTVASTTPKSMPPSVSSTPKVTPTTVPTVEPTSSTKTPSAFKVAWPWGVATILLFYHVL